MQEGRALCTAGHTQDISHAHGKPVQLDILCLATRTLLQGKRLVRVAESINQQQPVPGLAHCRQGLGNACLMVLREPQLSAKRFPDIVQKAVLCVVKLPVGFVVVIDDFWFFVVVY